MKTKPILFSTDMVQAILDGRKTMTRRLSGLEKLNKNPTCYRTYFRLPISNGNVDFVIRDKKDGSETALKPRYNKHDILYVKETHTIIDGTIVYRADAPASTNIKWKPSLFMKKEYARIFLEVTNVRCERLHDITDEDARYEGVKRQGDFYNYIHNTYSLEFPKKSFMTLWFTINGVDSWDGNPWVFVYEFKRIEKPEKL